MTEPQEIRNGLCEVRIVYRGYFKDEPRGGEWHGVPRDIRELLEKVDGSIYSGITEHLHQNKHYEITIAFKQL